MEFKNHVRYGSRKKAAWIICGAIAAVALLIGGIVLAVQLTGDRKGDVEAFCVEDITDQLRDPASAEFYDLNEVTQVEGKEFYGFEGKVRSRNGFGGMVNSQFSCTVAYTDGEPSVTSWTY